MMSRWFTLFTCIWMVCDVTNAQVVEEILNPEGYDVYNFIVHGQDGKADVTMDCWNKSGYDLEEVRGWMLPNLTILALNTNYGDYETTDRNLTVRGVLPEDYGQYHCILELFGDGTPFLVKFGINMRGPYYKDLWEEYRMNTIIGLSAFFATLLVVAGTMVVYKYRWQPSEKDRDLYDPHMEGIEASKPSDIAKEEKEREPRYVEIGGDLNGVVNYEGQSASNPAYEFEEEKL